VVNAQSITMVSITIHTDKGKTAVTDPHTVFTLNSLADDTYTLTPSHGGTVFSPASRSVVVPPQAIKVNFTARVLCSEPISMAALRKALAG
jgi:hypothetical protein